MLFRITTVIDFDISGKQEVKAYIEGDMSFKKEKVLDAIRHYKYLPKEVDEVIARRLSLFPRWPIIELKTGAIMEHIENEITCVWVIRPERF